MSDKVNFEMGERLAMWSCKCGNVNIHEGPDPIADCRACGEPKPKPVPMGEFTVSGVNKDAGTFTVSE